MGDNRLLCQRIGCSARYQEAENADGSCRYHAGAPLFHDGGKSWSCCKAKSHDFGLFMSLPGCTVGRHSQEKPPKPAESPNKPVPVVLPPTDLRASCIRCKQGFFCSDHAAVPGMTPKPVPPPPPPPPPPVPRVPAEPVDPDAEQKCARKGCGAKFTERDNTDLSCKFHPGPPVFHDRSKGWGCCDVHSKDFDEFLAIEPCAVGRHKAIDE